MFKNKDKIIKICLLILLNTFISIAVAADHYNKLWLSLWAEGAFPDNSKILYAFSPQVRFVNQNNYFYHSQALAGLGYQILPNWNVLSGYEIVSHNNLSGTARQNRIWQQLFGFIIKSDSFNLLNRTRLEERHRVGEPQWSDRLRERVTLQFPGRLCHFLTPVIWDEIFINVTQPKWVNQTLFNQNRVFAGVDIPTSKNAFLEVGYLNQYELSSSRDQLNNVLFVFYYIRLS